MFFPYFSSLHPIFPCLSDLLRPQDRCSPLCFLPGDLFFSGCLLPTFPLELIWLLTTPLNYSITLRSLTEPLVSPWASSRPFSPKQGWTFRPLTFHRGSLLPFFPFLSMTPSRTCPVFHCYSPPICSQGWSETPLTLPRNTLTFLIFLP